MHVKYVDPGLPTWPALYVDEERSEAYLSMRIADWVAMDRARAFVKVFAVTYGLFAIVIAYCIVPVTENGVVHLLLIGLVAVLAVSTGSTLILRALPEPLARVVFARRLRIYCTPDVLAFRSWYYDNGVRIRRHDGGVPLSIQPNIAADPDAAAHKACLPPPNPNEPHKPRHHYETAMQLQIVIRSGVGDDIVALSNPRRFKTIPVASMASGTAEHFATLISVALDLTTKQTPSPTRDAVGLDLDIDPRRGNL